MSVSFSAAFWHHFDTLAVLLRRAIGAGERDVGLALDDRHGRAQLVRGIGHEAALHVERALQPLEEIVQRDGQEAEPRRARSRSECAP